MKLARIVIHALAAVGIAVSIVIAIVIDVCAAGIALLVSGENQWRS